MDAVGLAGLVCAGGAVVVFVALVVTISGWITWRSYRRSQDAFQALLPEDLRDLPDLAPVSAIRDPVARRDRFLARVAPDLARLGNDRVVTPKPDGGVRLEGTMSGRCVVEIDPTGRVTRATVTRDFDYGGAVLRASGDHVDPDGLLASDEAGQVAMLAEQLQEVGVREVRFQTSFLIADVEACVFDARLGEMRGDLGGVLAVLENAASLWSWHRREPEPEPEPELPSHPVAATFARAQRASSSDEGVALAHEGLRVLFAACQPLLQKPKIVLEDGLTLGELRGRLGAYPARLVLSDTWLFEIEVQVDVGGVAVYRYDPDLAPKGGDPDDPFAAEDEQRVFVARGVFCEGSPDSVEEFLQYTAGMPPEHLERIRTAMIDLDLFQVHYGMDTLYLRARPYAYDLPDPGAWAQAALRVVPELVRNGAPVSEPSNVVGCVYCGSRFYFGVRRQACPNCGAPHGAAG